MRTVGLEDLLVLDDGQPAEENSDLKEKKIKEHLPTISLAK
jgi:uncharacterized protein (DUF849 family)